jgi:CxxC motif-containing protein
MGTATASMTPPDGGIVTARYLCIQCPIGCHLEVDATDGEVLEVRGASCTQGERYARQEHVDPRRSVSTTVAVRGASVARLPVRTADPVPKGRVRDVVRAVRTVIVAAPVRRGDVVVHDVLGLGADVIATRTLGSRPQNRLREHDPCSPVDRPPPLSPVRPTAELDEAHR